MQLPKILKTISRYLKDYHNSQAVIVGGSVRDYFLQLPIKDYDIEVYGLSKIEELETILSKFGSVNLVGKSFGVLKFVYQGMEYDFSFPRLESKVGVGHCGFDVICNGSMEFKDASLRRDFTINAMGYNIETKEFLDPYNGREDIKNRTLKHINSKSFIEDPLRVYRAVGFCARFNFKLDSNTERLCQNMVKNGDLEELPKERVYTEFKKLFLKSQKPSIGFELMKKLGILRYFPELNAIINIPQDKKYHPEGDVWIHTMMSIDAMVKLKSDNERDNLRLFYATLCHDFGKATTTKIVDNRVRAISHEQAGLEPTKSFLYRITNEHSFINSILPLVKYHLSPSQLFSSNSSIKAVARLATKVNIEELIIVAKADFLGRTTEEAKIGVYYAGDWLLEMAKSINIENRPLDNLLQGRDLIKIGLKPSKEFKYILDKIYELQINQEIKTKEEALNYVRHLTKLETDT